MTEDQAEIYARYFEAMATRIRLNAGAPFGGCFVIVPPADGGSVLQMLVLDSSAETIGENKGSAASFWSLVHSQAQMQIATLSSGEYVQGRRR